MQIARLQIGRYTYCLVHMPTAQCSRTLGRLQATTSFLQISAAASQPSRRALVIEPPRLVSADSRHRRHSGGGCSGRRRIPARLERLERPARVPRGIAYLRHRINAWGPRPIYLTQPYQQDPRAADTVIPLLQRLACALLTLLSQTGSVPAPPSYALQPPVQHGNACARQQPAVSFRPPRLRSCARRATRARTA